MKRTVIAAALAAAALFNAPGLDAKPAKPGLIDRTMADGSTVKVRLAGDEYYHYYLTEDGYPLVERDGILYYGNVDAKGELVAGPVEATSLALRTPAARDFLTGVDKARVGAAIDARRELSPRLARKHDAFSPMRAPRQANPFADEGYPQGPGLFPGTAFPSKGDQKALVVLVEYTDTKFNLTDPLDYFSRMLNETGFADYGGTGCAKEYFELNSGGVFRPQFDVVGPITLSKSMSYYGGNDWWGNDQHPEEMVIEACQQLDATVDFTEYDRDGDGYIDNVFVFYAGKGEASSGIANTVWPHSWDISAATSIPYYFDGVRLDRYGCSNEWEAGRPDGVGTFIHEFSHVMGLPDLYATSYTSAFTPGAWSALDYGPYNNDGMTPPLYGAFERYALGWTAPAVLDRGMNATLPPVVENVTGIIKTAKDTEFFLLENRQQTGWDAYIPGHGMLIWHVDYDDYIWSSNSVNNASSHQYVDIEEADNTRNEYSYEGDAFPGSQHVTSFTSSTTPAMKTWNGTAIDMPLTEIAESADGIITFKVKGGHDGTYDAVVVNEPAEVDDESFVASWVKTDAGSYILNVFTLAADGKREYLPGFYHYNAGDTDQAFVGGLEPSTEYYYTVIAAYGLEWSPESEPVEAYTGVAGINRMKVEALDATEVSHEGFNATWNHLEGATDYLLTVYYRDYGSSFKAGCDFTAGATTLPAGFSATSASTYANTSYSGEAIPALRLPKSGDTFAAEFEDGIRGISFWHRGNSTSEGDVINVFATVGAARELIATVPVVTVQGGVVTEITDFPENSVKVTLEFVRTGSKGALALDDVTVSHGITFEDVVVDGYDHVSTGYVTSHPVSGLLPESDYFYTVAATDGSLTSRHSELVKVTTLADSGQSGIATPGAVAPAINLSGRTLSVEAAGAVTVADMSGRIIAAGRGSLRASLPASGIYVVVADGVARKLIVH